MVIDIICPDDRVQENRKTSQTAPEDVKKCARIARTPVNPQWQQAQEHPGHREEHQGDVEHF